MDTSKFGTQQIYRKDHSCLSRFAPQTAGPGIADSSKHP